jgi:hypothetical protein
MIASDEVDFGGGLLATDLKMYGTSETWKIVPCLNNLEHVGLT